MSADLRADTAVRADPDVPGRFHLALPNHWDYLLPSGGVVMTCALRAAEAAVADPRFRVASATTIFASPIHPTALIADAAIIRRGKSAIQVRVALRHAVPPIDDSNEDEHEANHTRPDPDASSLECIVTLLRERRGPDVPGAVRPAVRSLADALRVEDGVPGNPHTRFRFYQQLETRIADGEQFWSPDASPPFVAGPARYARWFRYRTPQRDADGRFDRLALPPLMDTMPTALHRAIGPGPYRFFAPSLDLTTYLIDDTAREWVLVATTLRRARHGWAIGDCEVWDDEGRFLAHGSQAMYLQGLSGAAPIVSP